MNAYVSYLEDGQELVFDIQSGWGVYIGNLEGGTLVVDDESLQERGAARITDKDSVRIRANGNVEILLLEVSVTAPYITKYV